MLQHLLARLGIGSLKIEVVGGGGEHPRGSEMSGAVAVTGGVVPQRIERLTVTLQEFVSQGKSQEIKALVVAFLGADIDVLPEAKLRFPFTIQLPDDLLLTTTRLAAATPDLIRLFARAEISWAVDPRAKAGLTIVPHREILAVQHALLSMGYTRHEFLHFKSAPPDAARQDFRAPFNLRDQIDGVTIELHLRANFLVGNLILNLAEHSLAERLKAAVGAERQPHALMIPRTDVVDRHGEPFPEGALPYVQRILDNVLVPRDQNKAHLLRPASAPADPGDLLRPAAGSPAQGADELLRGADPPERRH